MWELWLYPPHLDRLSDAACRAVMAHEFAHVASGLPSGIIKIRGKRYSESKDATDMIVLEWGFSEECQALLRED